MDSSKRFRPSDSKNYSEKRTYAPKRSKGDACNSRKKNQQNNCVIFDNGAYSIKIGHTNQQEPRNLPNHIMKAKSERKRCFIGDQIEDCRDLSGLYYIMPHEHGYIAKFDVQKTIWDYTFHKYPIYDSSVIMTQPILNFKHVQEYMDEIFFEEYDVKSVFRANSTDMSRYQYIHSVKDGQDSPCLVVDSGYSFTHIVPYINGKKYMDGIVRMEVGGKLLTNYLKDILSYRQLHVMEETYVINQVKEDTCFMSANFKADMNRARNTNEIVQNYVLPDFHNIRRGYVNLASTADGLAENCQILRLNNERISVPEVVMKPSVIPGLEQAGLAQCIANSISHCPERFRKALADNVVLTGGNCLFPGFKDRVESETRIHIPCHHRLTVYQPENAINYAWQGGRSISQDPRFSSLCVTKQEYEENGSTYTFKKFNVNAAFEENPPTKAIEIPFSYLEHWEKEGVSLFHKPPITHVPNESNIQFKLEGEGIEEFDGKYVTIEFEYENNEPKPPETITKLPEQIISKVNNEMVKDLGSIPHIRLLKKKKSIIRLDPTSSTSGINTISRINTPTRINTTSGINSTINFKNTNTTITLKNTNTTSGINSSINLKHTNITSGINSTIHKNTEMPSTSSTIYGQELLSAKSFAELNMTKPPTTQKVYKPVFKAKSDSAILDPQRTQYLKYAQNSIHTIKGKSIIVPTSGNMKTVVGARHLLNNAVIVPQKLLPNNILSLQLFPFRPDLIKQGRSVIITKKPPQ